MDFFVGSLFKVALSEQTGMGVFRAFYGNYLSYAKLLRKIFTLFEMR